jgi:hypothetical protein
MGLVNRQQQPPDDSDSQDTPAPPTLGEPLALDDLLALAEIDAEDIEAAILAWDRDASLEWKGALG